MKMIHLHILSKGLKCVCVVDDTFGIQHLSGEFPPSIECLAHVSTCVRLHDKRFIYCVCGELGLLFHQRNDDCSWGNPEFDSWKSNGWILNF